MEDRTRKIKKSIIVSFRLAPDQIMIARTAARDLGMEDWDIVSVHQLVGTLFYRQLEAVAKRFLSESAPGAE